MTVAGQRVAVNVCYEDVFGDELIHALPTATLMVNVSNDAWFGNSFAPWQHLQISQMRALETGRWWLRANNTGITAILDTRGHVRAHLPPFSTDALHGTAQGYRGLTPYARWGDGGILALSALALAAAGWWARRAHRRMPLPT
jgi:apolipoprotein N-acyltransferase